MVKAVLDRVFIRLDKQEKRTEGGIILTDGHDTERTVGTVEEIGPDVKADIKPGDRVLFHIFDELPTYDPDVVVVRESSLLGILTDD
mgnify:FL=1